METLRAELARAKEQARRSDAAALKAARELRAKQVAHCERKEKIAKMAVELEDAADRYQLLEEENWAKVMDLEKARVAAKEARFKIRVTKEELNQAADIVSRKPFLLRTKFRDPKYAPLDRLWSSADAYMDLAASAADAAEYFKDQKGPEVEKLFWSQFHAPVRPLLLNERLAEWAELHRLSGLAMRSVVDHLWPGGQSCSGHSFTLQSVRCC